MRAKGVLHDARLPDAYKKCLQDIFPHSVLIPFEPLDTEVYGSISCHPDIYFFQVDADTLLYSPGIPVNIIEELTLLGIKMIPGERSPGKKYPSTALYNAARVGNRVFLNTGCADLSVMKAIKDRGLIAEHVSQGYSRCSVFRAGEEAFITSDASLAAAGRRSGLDVLEITPGHIELPGERYGFIGGTGGMSPGGEIVMLGDPESHPDGEAINAFIARHSKGYERMKDLPLYDAGTLLIF